jgi:gluconolactonase
VLRPTGERAAHTDKENAVTIERASTEIDRIVPRNSDVEKLADGFVSAEGPVWWAEGGYLLFSDWRPSRRYKWAPGSRPTLVQESTNEGNGTTRDRQGRLLVCERFASAGRVTAIDDDGKVEIVSDNCQGRPLSSANDVIVSSSGAVYFTSPAGEGSGMQVNADHGFTFVEPVLDEQGRSLGRGSVHWVAAEGTTSVAADTFLVPNGLALSPDESLLYVDDSRRMHIRAFAVSPDCSVDLDSDRVFFEFDRSYQLGIPDGMKVDIEGNVYCTGPGGVWVISPGGKHLGTISTGYNHHTNCAWGGQDWTTLFITTHEALCRIQLSIPGVAVPSP